MTGATAAARRMFRLTPDEPSRLDPVTRADARTSMDDARVALAAALGELAHADRNGYVRRTS